MTVRIQPNEVTLVCNPFIKIGRGVAALNLFRAFREAYFPPNVCDISSRLYNDSEAAVEAELAAYRTQAPGNRVNIYVINADEIELTKSYLGEYPRGAYNIIYPAWELSKCPPDWREKLSVFDEVWAPSRFVQAAFQDVFDRPVHYMPHPIDVSFTHFLHRSYFGLPDHSYLFLFFFDFRSYIERKNPFAVIEAFERMLNERPAANTHLVMKIGGAESSPKAGEDLARLLARIDASPARRKIITLDRIYAENAIRNLTRCCDCFVSLHRAEGFGLGLAEAMFLGKPVIATQYSGNVDFTTGENSYPVDYSLVPIGDGEYPNWEGQEWAEPDVAQAASIMTCLVDDPEAGRRTGRRASRDIRTNLSPLAVGVQAKNRILEIASSASG